MQLYRERAVNPLGGCLPMLADYPCLFAVYHAIQVQTKAAQKAGWMWIGSALSFKAPAILATSMAQSDLILLVAYVAFYGWSMLEFDAAFHQPGANQPALQQQLIDRVDGGGHHAGGHPEAEIARHVPVGLGDQVASGHQVEVVAVVVDAERRRGG